MQRTWQGWIWRIASRFALIYLGLVVLLALLQRHFIYFPGRADELDLLREAERNGLFQWRDRDNRLIGWRSRLPGESPRPRGRVVVFHGNAGYALHRIYYIFGFRGVPDGALGWDVYLFEYPGYGARPGPRNEENIAAEARRALQELLLEDPSPAYLAGESLGSSFASRLAAESPDSVAGLFLVTPLTSLADVAARHYPIFPVRRMLRERHDVREYLKSYPGPVAFLVAGRDEVMKGGLGERLYREFRGRKRLWMQPQAGHNTLDLMPDSPWWREVAEFLEHPDGGSKER